MGLRDLAGAYIPLVVDTEANKVLQHLNLVLSIRYAIGIVDKTLPSIRIVVCVCPLFLYDN